MLLFYYYLILFWELKMPKFIRVSLGDVRSVCNSAEGKKVCMYEVVCLSAHRRFKKVPNFFDVSITARYNSFSCDEHENEGLGFRVWFNECDYDFYEVEDCSDSAFGEDEYLSERYGFRFIELVKDDKAKSFKEIAREYFNGYEFIDIPIIFAHHGKDSRYDSSSITGWNKPIYDGNAFAETQWYFENLIYHKSID